MGSTKGPTTRTKATVARPMGPVEARVVAWLSAGSLSATAYLRIPPERVVELGTQREV